MRSHENGRLWSVALLVSCCVYSARDVCLQFSPTRYVNDLPEPFNGCQGSIVAINDTLWFSHPNPARNTGIAPSIVRSLPIAVWTDKCLFDNCCAAQDARRRCESDWSRPHDSLEQSRSRRFVPDCTNSRHWCCWVQFDAGRLLVLQTLCIQTHLFSSLLY